LKDRFNIGTQKERDMRLVEKLRGKLETGELKGEELR
jgi:hypothetical protein